MTDKERGEIRSYFKGHPAYVPLWFQILAAADFDPLRAQEMEERLIGKWWHYHGVMSTERSKAEKQMSKRTNRGK